MSNNYFKNWKKNAGKKKPSVSPSPNQKRMGNHAGVDVSKKVEPVKPVDSPTQTKKQNVSSSIATPTALEPHPNVIKAVEEGKIPKHVNAGAAVRVEIPEDKPAELSSVSPDFPFPIEVDEVIAHNLYESEIYSEHVGRYGIVVLRNVDSVSESYLGISVGKLPLGIGFKYNPETKAIDLSASSSDLCFVVPQLGRIVSSDNCEWRPIETLDDIRSINDDGAIMKLAEFALQARQDDKL